MPQMSKKTEDPIQPKAVNNARDDKLLISRFWTKSFEDRRCLIPATSYCVTKGRSPATYVWFGVVGDEERPPFALAGIWRAYKGNHGGGEEREMSLINGHDHAERADAEASQLRRIQSRGTRTCPLL